MTIYIDYIVKGLSFISNLALKKEKKYFIFFSPPLKLVYFYFFFKKFFINVLSFINQSSSGDVLRQAYYIIINSPRFSPSKCSGEIGKRLPGGAVGGLAEVLGGLREGIGNIMIVLGRAGWTTKLVDVGQPVFRVGDDAVGAEDKVVEDDSEK